jgi:hypothetical protein
MRPRKFLVIGLDHDDNYHTIINENVVRGMLFKKLFIFGEAKTEGEKNTMRAMIPCVKSPADIFQFL